jgi:Xaa-Pro aminopeptidase
MTKRKMAAANTLNMTSTPLFNRERANAIMDEKGLNALIASSDENLLYVTGFHPGLFNRPQRRRLTFAIVTRDESQPVSVVMPHYYLSYLADRPIVAGQLWTYGFYSIADQNGGLADETARHFRALLATVRQVDDGVSGLLRALEDLGLAGKRVGLDEYGVSPDDFRAVEAELSRERLVPAAGLFRQIRMIKTPEEITRLRKSTRIAQEAISRVIQEVQAGITEYDLELIFREEVTRHEAHFTFACMPAGMRSALPACLTSDYEIQLGDLVKLDAGCLYEHYHSDIGRTVILGEPSQKQAGLYEAMWAGTKEAVAMIKPGVLASEVFELAMKVSRASGIPDFQRHHCGHGQGLEGYEPPLIAPEDDTPLETGMVLNIETPYNEVGFGGMIIEETVLVTAEGGEQITSIDSDLYVV